MSDILERGLRLNTVTGPKVNNPAVSPDTLRELEDVYYGFLQVYTLKSAQGTWHGQLSNIGMQYTIPFSILMPPNLTEVLGLNNEDSIILTPSLLSEAHTIHFQVIGEPTEMDAHLPELHEGAEIGVHTRYNYQERVIELLKWEPEGCFFGPGTTMIHTDHVPHFSFSPENQAEDVVTGLGSLPSNKNNPDANQNEPKF